MTTELSEPVELGAWMGHSQAFGILASQSCAAQAQSLRRIRDASAYKLLHLTWDEFCRDHVGLTRPRVDAMLHRLDEFGETYFRLCEIVRLSPVAYRQIEPNIQGGQLEVNGALIEIAPENAVAIRAAVTRLRLDLKHAKERADRLSIPAIADLHHRLNQCFQQIAVLSESQLSETETSGLRGLVNFAAHSVSRLAKNFKE
jgi:hypothetical protein